VGCDINGGSDAARNEAAFGALLEWWPMPGCLIEAAIRKEKALREPVRAFKV
jgi:hypothetical protein